MLISQIKDRVASEFPVDGFAPPPESWRTKNRTVWIGEMWKLEQLEIVQDEY